MKLIERLDAGQAGINWKAGRPDETCVADMLHLVSDSKINMNDDRHYHLKEKLQWCSDCGLAIDPKCLHTYREILVAFQCSWDTMKGYQVPYRVLEDIYRMDDIGKRI